MVIILLYAYFIISRFTMHELHKARCINGFFISCYSCANMNKTLNVGGEKKTLPRDTKYAYMKRSFSSDFHPFIASNLNSGFFPFIFLCCWKIAHWLCNKCALLVCYVCNKWTVIVLYYRDSVMILDILPRKNTKAAPSLGSSQKEIDVGNLML